MRSAVNLSRGFYHRASVDRRINVQGNKLDFKKMFAVLLDFTWNHILENCRTSVSSSTNQIKNIFSILSGKGGGYRILYQIFLKFFLKH